MKNNKFSAFSILISVICMIIIIWINFKIADKYLESEGKTKALFGIIEFTNFYYKYYFASLSLLALIFSIISSKKNENKLTIKIAYVLCLLSFISIFVEFWKLII